MPPENDRRHLSGSADDEDGQSVSVDPTEPDPGEMDPPVDSRRKRKRRSCHSKHKPDSRKR